MPLRLGGERERDTTTCRPALLRLSPPLLSRQATRNKVKQKDRASERGQLHLLQQVRGASEGEGSEREFLNFDCLFTRSPSDAVVAAPLLLFPRPLLDCSAPLSLPRNPKENRSSFARTHRQSSKENTISSMFVRFALSFPC